MKNINIPCFFKAYAGEAISSNLVPVRITLLHDKANRNNTSIDLDTIKKAEDSIKNKPILAYLKKDDDNNVDFSGHEIKIELVDDVDDPVKVTYLERPVGVIPESTEITYTEVDGLTYMSCTGYIYKNYSNETLGLIEETGGKCVSIEIKVLEGNDADDIYEITNFDFLGVSILSDEEIPGMDECCMITLENQPTYATFLYKALEDVKTFEHNNSINLDENGGVDGMDKDKEEVIDEVAEDEITNDEENKVEDEVSDTEDNENIEEVENTTDDGVETDEDTPEDNEASNEPENTEGNVETETDDNIEEQVSSTDDVAETIDYKSISEVFGVDIENFEQLIEKSKTITEELNELKEYKERVEKEKHDIEIETTYCELGFTCDGLDELKEEAKEKNYTIENFKAKAYQLYGMAMANKDNKPKKDKRSNYSSIILSYNDNKKESTSNPYGELFNDIFI